MALIICFIGMDATGKTLYSQWLYRLLRESGEKVTYIHILSSKGSFLRRVISSWRFGRRIKARIMQGDPYRPRRGLIKLSPVITFIDSLITYLILLRSKSRMGIVICDRYFYDLIAIWACIGLMRFKIAYAFIKTMPKPDVLFMFEAKPETAYNRKREHPLSFYEAQWKFYQGLKSALKPISVDTENHNIQEVRELILKCLMGKFP